MDTLKVFNEEAASPPKKYCARPINRMGYSPRAVSNQRKGSRFPAQPLNQPQGFESGTSSFRGGRFAHCATWTPTAFPVARLARFLRDGTRLSADIPGEERGANVLASLHELRRGRPATPMENTGDELLGDDTRPTDDAPVSLVRPTRSRGKPGRRQQHRGVRPTPQAGARARTHTHTHLGAAWVPGTHPQANCPTAESSLEMNVPPTPVLCLQRIQSRRHAPTGGPPLGEQIT